jgi:hypothetical protein
VRTRAQCLDQLKVLLPQRLRRMPHHLALRVFVYFAGAQRTRLRLPLQQVVLLVLPGAVHLRALAVVGWLMVRRRGAVRRGTEALCRVLVALFAVAVCFLRLVLARPAVARAMGVRVEQLVELVVDGGRHGCGVGDATRSAAGARRARRASLFLAHRGAAAVVFVDAQT